MTTEPTSHVPVAPARLPGLPTSDPTDATDLARPAADPPPPPPARRGGRGRLARSSAALLLTVALVGAAGCGGGGGGDDGGDVASVSGDDGDEQAASDDQEATEEELMDWAACMREEGIDIPDPVRDADGNMVIDGNGIHIGGGEMSGGVAVNQEEDADDDSDDEGPAFSPEDMQAAMEACGEPPGMGPSNMSEEDRQAMEDAAVEFAQCMRDEGIADFPDPDFSEEGPGGELQTAGPDEAPEPDDEQEGAVMSGPFGEIDMDDPDIAAAFEACQDIIPEGEGPGGEGPADGSGRDT